MWYDINCPDKILSWRKWRLSIDKLSPKEYIDEVALQWSRAPIVNHYLLADDIENWPTPWELINDNIYCDLAIALGMFYTISLSKHSDMLNPKIEIYNASSDILNLCSITMDNELKYLNYTSSKIVNKSTLGIKSFSNYVYSKLDLDNKLQ